jgi:hypothetical protein
VKPTQAAQAKIEQITIGRQIFGSISRERTMLRESGRSGGSVRVTSQVRHDHHIGWLQNRLDYSKLLITLLLFKLISAAKPNPLLLRRITLRRLEPISSKPLP